VRVGTPASRATALAAARQSLILLKNDAPAAAGGQARVLPLARNARVLVTGPTADSLPSLNNGWTLTWQGDRAAAYPTDRDTIRAALERRLGSSSVTYVPGSEYDKPLDVAAAVDAARAADVVVLCLGEKSYAETPGNIDDLVLPEAQLRLAREVAAAGKPVVLVLVEGRPRIINTIADALIGDENPSGRLPITYPRAANALLTYDHKAFEEQDTSFGLSAFKPQFEFGSGLSYTTFEYSNLSITLSANGQVDVSVTVRNTGARAGTDVVQLYLSQRTAAITPPVKRLKRFARVPLAEGASQTLRFRLMKPDFSYIGADGKPVIEPSAFSISVGKLHQEMTLREGD
jgi:beta-glucosidase